MCSNIKKKEEKKRKKGGNEGRTKEEAGPTSHNTELHITYFMLSST
jgi:hypothetical protein